MSMNHSLRIPLAAEIHSRPSLYLSSPERISHLAVFAGQEFPQASNAQLLQQQILADLCAYFGVANPAAEAKYFFHDFGRFRLKWECHTEFATYTFVDNAQTPPAGFSFTSQELFAETPLRHVPQTWIEGLAGRVMVAAHIALMKEGMETWSSTRLDSLFQGKVLVGSEVLDRGQIWTDFLIHADGYSRFIVRDQGFLGQQSGRTVQRLLEIETYRMMALLGLPQAQAALPVLSVIEGELVSLMNGMTLSSDVQQLGDDTDAEQQMLTQIIDLAARVEKLSLQNSYRFSASKAYFQLVNARIDELREQRIEGLPTIAEFMERRLVPAMQTCESVVRRQQALAARIAHTNDLLRTRVGILQEQQNRKILQSMNARAAQQLRLQQAVEGLSVAAISYYLVGLFSYVGKGLKAYGWALNPDLLSALLVPVIAVAVWLGLRRMHRQLH